MLDVVFVIIAFFLQLCMLDMFQKISKSKFQINKKIMILIMSTYVTSELFSQNIPAGIQSLISLIYFFILYKVVFKIDMKDIVFYSVVMWAVGVIIDISLMGIMNIILGNITVTETKIIFLKIISSMIMGIFFLLLGRYNKFCAFIDNTYKKIKKLNYSHIKLALLLVVYLVLDAICITIMDNKTMILMIFMLSIIFIITVAYFISQRYQILILKETNEILSTNIDFHIKLINEYRIMKHNLISKLMGIKIVSNEEGRLLIEELIKEYSPKFQSVQNVIDIPSSLNGLIYEKIYNFHHDELIIEVDNKIKRRILDIVKPKNYNLLCEALGVCLDNAMEAAAESKEKLIHLSFKENKEYIIIKITNTFQGTIDLSKLGEMNYTSKKHGHGIGLFSLFFKSNLKIKTSIKNNLFINEIKIPKKI